MFDYPAYLRKEADLAESEGMPDTAKTTRDAAEKIERLQRAIRWYFSLNPDHDECELIGRCILPLPDDIRRTIIEECEAAEGE